MSEQGPVQGPTTVIVKQTGPVDIAVGTAGGCFLVLFVLLYGCVKGCEKVGDTIKQGWNSERRVVETDRRRPEPPPPPSRPPPEPLDPFDWSTVVFWLLMVGGFAVLLGTLAVQYDSWSRARAHRDGRRLPENGILGAFRRWQMERARRHGDRDAR